MSPIPIAHLAAEAPRHRLGDLAAAAASARSAWSASRSGAPNTPSTPSPTNLFAWPPCVEQDRHHQLEEVVEEGHRLARARALGERGEVAHVHEQHRDLDLLALQQLALLEHPLGHVGVDVAAERLAQLLALGEPVEHLVEAAGELPSSSPDVDRHARVEVALLHALGGLEQVVDRAEDATS